MTHSRTLASILVALSLVGCFERSLSAVDPCTTSQQGVSITPDTVDSVDLLFLIDDSSSMTEHQVQLQQQIPRLVTTLVTGQRDAANGGNFTPPRSLHIGVVSSSMGLGPITSLASSGCPGGFGDDGVMHRCANATSPTPVGWFEFDRDHPPASTTAFATDVACAAVLGTGGCGLEYELEPILKALAPAPDASGNSSVAWTAPGYRPPTFYMGTPGHGADPATNGGFLRPNSVLAILTVNDEDDSSTDHYEIFSGAAPYSDYQLNVVPVAFSDQLFPVQRYVDGLIGLRTQPRHLIYSTITGIPNDLSPGPGVRTTVAMLDELLADPRMTSQIPEPMHTATRLVPVCMDTTGGQTAVPGRRMVEVARGLIERGATVAVHSICENDFTPAIDDIIDAVADAIQGECLGRALNPDANGQVECDVLELLPATGDTAHCASLEHAEAYAFVRMETSTLADGTSVNRELCRMRQIDRQGAAAGVPGWAYDDGNTALGSFSALPAGCHQRIGLSAVRAISGAELRLECTETILPGSGASAQLGAFCDPATGVVGGSTATCASGVAIAGHPTPLACDAFDRTCEVACTEDSDCTRAGLLSYVCDTRSATQVFGADHVPTGVSPTGAHHFCVNPTCGGHLL